MPASKTFKDYAALDGLRGYAVILVSLTHFVGFYVLAYRGLSVERATYFSVDNATDRLFLWLYLSMQSLYILLTISGYMVCRMVLRPNYAGYASFFVARAARIYPPLLFGLAFAVGTCALFGQQVDLSLGISRTTFWPSTAYSRSEASRTTFPAGRCFTRSFSAY